MPKSILRSTPFTLTVRKETKFDFSELTDGIHTENNIYISHLVNALSLLTPITEGLLIRAIREAMPLLKNSIFEEDALAFIGQEAIHTREHRELNRRLLQLGFDTQKAIDDVEAEVKKMENDMTLQERLSLVVTGEHAIYSLARAVMTSNFQDSKQQKDVKNLFIWHSLEEMEHQSICDDIYKHLYGDGIKHKLLHFKTYTISSKIIFSTVTKLMKNLLEQSRKPHKGEFNTFVLWLFHKKGIGTISIKELSAFFSPTFSHWRQGNEDQKIIEQGLKMVYPEKLA